METWGFAMPLIKYKVKKSRLFKALTLQAQVR